MAEKDMGYISQHTGIDRPAESMVSRKSALQAPAGSREGLSPLSSGNIAARRESVLPDCEPQAEAWRF